MPHLSPMNWIMAILMFWISMALMMSKSWWSNIVSMPFNIMLPKKHSTKQPWSWKWNW